MSTDAQLQHSVIQELGWEPSVTATDIGVSAKDGVVTLSGHVESFAEKHAAEMAARRVKGVNGLVEEIDVRLPFDRKRGDVEIAAAAVDRLGWDAAIPIDAIKVSVEKGWLTLTGAVEWNYQRRLAEDDLRRLSGVVGLSNQIQLRPKVNVAALSDGIQHALGRSWMFDAMAVKVASDGGRIHLTGTVPTWQDWEIASAAAWSAPGVASVDNDIRVG